MSAIVERCESCGALVDVEDLFCANCGTEIPDHRRGETARLAIDAKNFTCRGCGASMNYDASAQGLKCPFCGSVNLVEEESQGILAPECVVPFAISQPEAEDRLRAWLGSSVWHPGDLRSSAQLTDLKAVYIPCWIFTTTAKTHWTADTDQVPWGAKAGWRPIAGYVEQEHHDLWVPASAGLSVKEQYAIWPFDVSAAVPPEKVDLADVTVEQFTVSRRYARPFAQAQLESREAAAMAQGVPGKERNIHVNVLMEGATSRAALVPIYVMAYRYRERVYRFVINGQNGRSTGTAPISAAKVAGAVALVALAAIIILALFAH